MAKFIFIEPGENRVKYVEDSRPTTAFGPSYIEVSDDNVAAGWWYDHDSDTLSQYRPISVVEVRIDRDALLTSCDWMVLEDSPYKATGQESNLAKIKTYRQELRDFPNDSTEYNENNFVWPTLTLS